MSELPLIRPDWPAAPRVRAVSTTRMGGVSEGPWRSLNLADRGGDDPERVAANRARLAAAAGCPPPAWLEQVHGTDVAVLAGPPAAPPRADAAVTDRPGLACAVLTADCLPVLLCDRAGTRVAAAHAGWRGLQAGVLEQTVARFDDDPADLLAWLGPAIGPDRFEVGGEVREAFMASHRSAREFFRPSTRRDHWLADLYGLARLRLAAIGVTRVSGGEHCTVSDARRFFSYRRDGITGRMATLVWLKTLGGEAKSNG